MQDAQGAWRRVRLSRGAEGDQAAAQMHREGLLVIETRKSGHLRP